MVSMIDDHVKCAMSRLGGSPARGRFIDKAVQLDHTAGAARCALLARRVEEVLPGVRHAGFREADGGGAPLLTVCAPPRPPTSRTSARHRWASSGSGRSRHAGWTHGSGKALAELISGEKSTLKQPDRRSASALRAHGWSACVPPAGAAVTLLHCNIFCQAACKLCTS
jgi:D-amino-acid dehydrogenase